MVTPRDRPQRKKSSTLCSALDTGAGPRTHRVVIASSSEPRDAPVGMERIIPVVYLSKGSLESGRIAAKKMYPEVYPKN